MIAVGFGPLTSPLLGAAQQFSQRGLLPQLPVGPLPGAQEGADRRRTTGAACPAERGGEDLAEDDLVRRGL